MAGNTLVIRVHVDGVHETLAAYRRLPAEANAQLRDASGRIATLLASRIRAAAAADSPQSALMAPTVAVRRDRVPAVVAGGNARVGSRRTPAWKILFGSEFGSTVWPQFRPHRGSNSYWFYATVHREQAVIAAQWRRAADAIADSFDRG